MQKAKCGTCRFWEHDPSTEIKQQSAAGLIVDAADDTLQVGYCYGHPPQVVLAPAMTMAGPQVVPRYFDRQVLSKRPACSLYQLDGKTMN